MDLKEKAVIIHYHRHRQDTFDPETPRALGWKSDSSQQVRYGVLAEIADLNNASILEPGCGYADLLAFLDQRFKGVHYTGLDLVPEFLESAARKYAGRSNCQFVQGDFAKMALPRVDYVLASGALGYKTRDLTYYTRCIHRFYRTADKGVGFNMLDASAFPDHPLLTGHNREEILAFCQSLCPWVECIRGYLDDDFTIFMYKP